VNAQACIVPPHDLACFGHLICCDELNHVGYAERSFYEKASAELRERVDHARNFSLAEGNHPFGHWALAR